MTEEGNKQSSEDFSSWKRRATMVNYLLEGQREGWGRYEQSRREENFN
jgi:hypothetical protein